MGTALSDQQRRDFVDRADRGVASYPTDAPDGYVIWVSPVRTTSGYCYKDLGTTAA